MAFDFISSYLSFLKKAKWVIIVFWLLCAVGSVYPVTKLISATSLTFPAPKGSEGYSTEAFLKQYFPQYIDTGQFVILISHTGTQKNCTIVSCPFVRNFTYALRDAMMNYPPDPSFVTEFESYWTQEDAGYDDAATQLLSDDYQATLITGMTKERQSDKSLTFSRWLINDLLPNLPNDTDFTIERSGADILMTDFYGLAISEIIVTDSISCTIALLVLLVLLRSTSLMVIPIANLASSALCSFAIMYPIALNWNVGTFVPAICIAVIIAMCIDYALFLLVRFRHELDLTISTGNQIDSKSYEQALLITMKYAGRVIIISGTTLAITFLGLSILQLQFVITIGVCAAFCLLCTIASNLTLGPSLLLAFPNFFKIRGIIPCIKHCQQVPISIKTSEESLSHGSEMRKSIWFKIAKIVTTNVGAALVLCLVVSMLFPIMYANRNFSYKTDNSLVFTNNLPSVSALKSIQKYFPPGFIYPFYVVVTPKDERKLTWTKEFFDLVPKFAFDLKNKTENGIDDKGFISAPFAYGSAIDFKIAQKLTNSSLPIYNTTYSEMYRYLLAKVERSDHKSSLIMLMVNFDPMSSRTEPWIIEARNASNNYTQNTNFTWSLTSTLVNLIDASAAVFKAFPIMIAVTVIIVAILVTVAFRSLVLPIRLVFTLTLTVAWTYGLATIVFCLGALDWITNDLKSGVSLYWIVPVIVLSVIIGLGIDYDVFLFSRITEYREAGYSTQSAIRMGYFQTGSVITGAGIVMSIAFSGLMISKQHVLQQLGFFLSMSVLLDTFVIRMLVVPALMNFLGDANWWPRKMPIPTKDEHNNNNKNQANILPNSSPNSTSISISPITTTETTPLISTSKASPNPLN